MQEEKNDNKQKSNKHLIPASLAFSSNTPTQSLLHSSASSSINQYNDNVLDDDDEME